jgi:hypothetical protein
VSFPVGSRVASDHCRPSVTIRLGRSRYWAISARAASRSGLGGRWPAHFLPALPFPAVARAVCWHDLFAISPISISRRMIPERQLFQLSAQCMPCTPLLDTYSHSASALLQRVGAGIRPARQRGPTTRLGITDVKRDDSRRQTKARFLAVALIALFSASWVTRMATPIAKSRACVCEGRPILSNCQSLP